MVLRDRLGSIMLLQDLGSAGTTVEHILGGVVQESLED